MQLLACTARGLPGHDAGERTADDANGDRASGDASLTGRHAHHLAQVRCRAARTPARQHDQNRDDGEDGERGDGHKRGTELTETQRRRLLPFRRW